MKIIFFSFGQNINSKVKFNKLKKINKKNLIYCLVISTSLSQYVKLKNTNKINLPVSPKAYKLSFLKY